MKKLTIALMLAVACGNAYGDTKSRLETEQAIKNARRQEKEMDKAQDDYRARAELHNQGAAEQAKREHEAMKQPTRELQLKAGAKPKTEKEKKLVATWKKEADKKAQHDAKMKASREKNAAKTETAEKR